ncbi:hypothetical protein FB45DRAFT_889826 [Roridomyces roridus]|uniref:Uncharacterized protein n=1 Tax=Roridomyces roridus TaxID=1738132 RepID=A0AAD7CKJ1_9AGAR|nr:hypothetical protein FB45DRAFT_889826 [Roridomyces roridus]
MLPDEIVSEILSPALKVPDELFSDTSGISPFADCTRSAGGNYLLVCKDWLRVATPLLYNVVVLRSKAQAQALEDALEANPEFGRFIKKLRVEGGYGSSMHTILESAPNITDLVLSLAIRPADSTDGLCTGLSLINPRRLILLETSWQPLTNRQERALRNAVILDCIPSWSNLRIVGCPYSSFMLTMNPGWIDRAMNLSRALLKSLVHTTILCGDLDSIPSFVPPLYDIPSLETLQFQPLDVHYDAPLISIINGDKRLKQLAKYTLTDRRNSEVLNEPYITPSQNSHFTPMESASEQTRETVWKRVLFFAMYAEEASFSRRPSQSRPSRLPILSVSKDFHRLALPYLYDSVKLTTRNAQKLSDTLDTHPILGSFIRRIFTVLPWRTAHEPSLNVLRYANRLEVITPAPPSQRMFLTAEAFKLLVKNAGHSLQELRIGLGDMHLSASLFESFSALHTLDIEGTGLRATTLGLPSQALNSLHTLKVWCNPSILPVFEDMSLESLRSFSFVREDPSSFIKIHGPKLLHIEGIRSARDSGVLDLCPNLVDIDISDLDGWNFVDITPNNPHNSLTTIVASVMPGGTCEEEFNQEMFPALREIHITQLGWPTTEQAILESEVVPVAEYFLQRNIKLTSKEGKAWVPRLQSRRK